MTDEERIRRGEEARRILSEPLLLEAFESIERASVEELLRAPTSPDGDTQRRRMADRILTVRNLRTELETAIAIGTQAAKEAPGIY